MLRTAKQIMNIITATFPGLDIGGNEGPSTDCSNPFSGIERLRCGWLNITQQVDLVKNGLQYSPDRLLAALSNVRLQAPHETQILIYTVVEGCPRNYEQHR
jgi:hypothetical protein